MQPLGTQKNHSTFWKKNDATSWDKKSHNLLGQKNHATSQYKKTSRNLLGKHKKIVQPLGTKKNTQPLRTKKITQPLWTKKRAKMASQLLKLNQRQVTRLSLKNQV